MKQVAQNDKTGELSVLDVRAPGCRPGGVLVGAAATHKKVVNRLDSCTPKETLDAAAVRTGAAMLIAFESLVAATSVTIAVGDSLASGRPEPV
jgi:hypothetical protein